MFFWFVLYVVALCAGDVFFYEPVETARSIALQKIFWFVCDNI